MNVEYRRNDEKTNFWIVKRPEGLSFSEEGDLQLDFESCVDAVGVVGNDVLVKFKDDQDFTRALRAMNAMLHKLGFTCKFDSPAALDKAHLHSWGFYWSSEKLNDVSAPFVDMLKGTSPKVVSAYIHKGFNDRTVEKDRLQKQGDELRGTGQVEKVQELEADAQRHTRRLEVLSIQIGL
jgi:hypothetical protein